jgi:hypothetical protein
MKNQCKKTLVGQPEAKRAIERRRRRFQNNSEADLTELGRENVGRINLTVERDRYRSPVSTVMNFGYLQEGINFSRRFYSME